MTKTFDRSIFTDAAYVRRIEKPWGWELHWTPAGLPYVGKVLHINAGARLSMQVHELKQESWYLIAGRAKAVLETAAGDLLETELRPNAGYSCVPGQKHRLIAITDCDIVEVSTPEQGVTWRLEDDYARPHETDAQRARERGEAAG